MNRTSRSASRRASRQFAAYEPGLRASGPYKFEDRVRLLRQVHQLRHRGLHPVRHLVLRDARLDLRIAVRPPASSHSSFLTASSIARRVGLLTPGGSSRYSTGSRCRRGTGRPDAADGRNPLPQSRENSGWSAVIALACDSRTTKPGRFWFSLPRP